MKRLSVFLLLCAVSMLADANDVAVVARYFQAQVQVLKAQVAQLQRELSSPQQAASDAGGFMAINAAMAKAGFTTMQFYQFQSEHKTAIIDWRQKHPTEAKQIQTLERQQAQLIEAYDQNRKGTGQ